MTRSEDSPTGASTVAEMRLVTWPNAISLLRLPLALAFVGANTAPARGVILLAAAASDWVDGWLARRLGQRSRIGEILDALADKVFVIVAFASFTLTGQLEPWELFVLIARDLYTSMVFALGAILGLGGRFRSRWGGKIVTTLQVVAVLTLVLKPAWVHDLVLVTAAASLYAVIDYTRAGILTLRGARSAG